MWEGYMSLAGVEVVNSARAVAYAAQAGLSLQCEPCDSVAAAVGEDRYIAVDEDAPWYDPGRPISKGFIGVMGMDVAGFSTGPFTRSPTALVGDGSALGPLRRTHREISYTVVLIAQGECELSYGLEWLGVVLLGSTCAPSTCSGDEMCVFACCPGDSLAGQEGDEFGRAEFRRLFDVGLLEGPTLTERRYLTGGFIWATVTFTLAAAKPWIYREPLLPVTDWVPLGQGDIHTRQDPDKVFEQCLQPKPCLEDPLCPPPPLPPAPPAPVSPCYPTGVADFRVSNISVSPLDQSQWLETVPLVEVRTGSGEMRRLLVRFWQNPQDNPCEDQKDPCQACADINVSYLPPGSTLTVDGRVQRSVVECPQFPVGTATALPTVHGVQGASFQWPSFPCPTGLCIEVWSRLDSTAVDAEARVLMIPRSDLG